MEQERKQKREDQEKTKTHLTQTETRAERNIYKRRSGSLVKETYELRSNISIFPVKVCYLKIYLPAPCFKNWKIQYKLAKKNPQNKNSEFNIRNLRFKSDFLFTDL